MKQRPVTWVKHSAANDLGRFVSDEGDNHAVQVEEEHHQVERELGK